MRDASPLASPSDPLSHLLLEYLPLPTLYTLPQGRRGLLPDQASARASGKAWGVSRGRNWAPRFDGMQGMRLREWSRLSGTTSRRGST